MRYLPKQEEDPNVLVGLEHPDDGAIYQLTEEIALIQTLDFFTPIVDDPYQFGQIAAANALSDIYAMGGTPKTVLNIVGYPIKQLGPKILAKILEGSASKVKEAGAQVVGGHSIDDQEPKFGLSVTGIVHPDRFFTNVGAKEGDVLILTKPIGVGVHTTALKQNILTTKQIDEVTEIMITLNKAAQETLQHFQVHAVTDVTGFGLLGHAYEMASGSEVSFIIEMEKVPFLPQTLELIEENIVPGGSRENHRWLKDKVDYANHITKEQQLLLCDAITSGGLFISMPKKEGEQFIQTFHQTTSGHASIIGTVQQKQEKSIYIR